MPQSDTHISTSGGLLTQAFTTSIRELDVGLPATAAASFALPWDKGPARKGALEDTIATAYELLLERWDAVQAEFDTMDVSEVRRRWLLPLMSLLGFEPVFQRGDTVLGGEGGLRFPLSHRGWDAPHAPVLHLMEPGQDLDARMGSGRGPKGKSPHDMLQLYLNSTSNERWAVLSNGRVLRLLRDYHHTFAKGYVQFDLEAIFETRNYADFRALYRLAHASRFRPLPDDDRIPLELFYKTALATGVKVGEDLRGQVRRAIEHLGNGLLDPDLIQTLADDPDAALDYYREVLRVVYRMLFLLFAEQRGMIPAPGARYEDLYRKEYSLTALRERAETDIPRDDGHTDLWEGLQVTFAMVRDGADDLGVFGYNGELFSDRASGYLNSRSCSNTELLEAVRALTLVEREGVLQRISYLDLGVEELGSIYESLLDFTPRVSSTPETIDEEEIPAHTFFLDPRGLERKKSGSYYTPSSLVNELIKSALLPVMHDRLQRAGLPVVAVDDREPGSGLGEVTATLLEEYGELTDAQRKAGEEALLSVTVCDPAVGSGHFLVKANNVMAAELARIRSGDPYPTEIALQAAKRDVLGRCIYAVDLNPMAVELCKVSLWINASVKDQPLNFLDHHIKCGNSLIGATPDLLKDGVPYEAFDQNRSGVDRERAKAFRKQNRQERKQSKDGIGVQLGAFAEGMATDPAATYAAGDFAQLAQDDPKQAREVYATWSEDATRQRAKLEADAWTAAFFWPMNENTNWAPTYGEVFRLQREGPGAIPTEEVMQIKALADEHRFFHWHLEFPSVFGRQTEHPEQSEGSPSPQYADGPHGDGQASENPPTPTSPDAHTGFDVVLGNPPWERIKIEDKQFFAEKSPRIADASTKSKRRKMIKSLRDNDDPLYHEYQRAQQSSEALSVYLRKSGRFPLTAQGDIDNYQIFAGLTRQIKSLVGRVGLLLPTGIATNYYNQEYFCALVEKRELHSLFDFENSEALFREVDRNQKFCLLTLTGIEAPSQEIDFVFGLTRTDELADPERHFTLTPEELYRINPNTGTCPTFRSKRDAELTKKLYAAAPVLINETEDENPWGVSFSTMFHMSNDSNLFHTREELEAEGFELEGNRFVRGEDKYMPLYEGKMIHQFDHRFASTVPPKKAGGIRGGSEKTGVDQYKDPTFCVSARYNVAAEEIATVSSKEGWFLAFRDVTGTVANVRTSVFTLIPKTAAGNKAPMVLLSGNQQVLKGAALVSTTNSFVFDFASRQKITGLSFNFYILKQLPVPAPEHYTPELLEYIVPRVLELTYTAWDLAAFADDVWNESEAALQSAIEAQWQANAEATGGGHRGAPPPAWVEHSEQAHQHFPHPPFMWDEERRRYLRAELDALYGHLYGLTRDEMDYILETFPIVKRKDEEQHGEYRTKRLVLEAYDALVGAGVVGEREEQGV